MRITSFLIIALLFTGLSTGAVADESMVEFQKAYSAYESALQKGNHKLATSHARTALYAGLEAFEPNNENIVVLADNYAGLLLKTGKAKAAAQVYKDMLKENEKAYGRYAPSLMPYLSKLYKLAESKNPKLARTYQERYYQLLFRHNPEKIVESTSEGELKVPERLDSVTRSVESVVGSDFTHLNGEHWIVIHPQGNSEGAQTVSDQIELAYKSMRSFFIAAGLSTTPLDTKLLMVMFNNQDDYLEYAASQNVSITRKRGSYFEDLKLLLFFDVEKRDGPKTYLTRTNILAQEGFQQLAVAAGLFPEDKKLLPRWLYDGLSYTFEFNKIDEPFGPHKDNLSARNWGLAQDLIDKGEWLPLNTLIRFMPEEEHLPENKTIIYIMGTYFIRFLYEERTEAFIEYIKLLNKGSADDQSSRTRGKIAKRAFGDIDKLDKEWRRYLQRKAGLNFQSAAF